MQLRRKVPCTLLGVYAVTRHYGGPEEGGWWFDWMEHIESVPVKPEKAERIYKKLSSLNPGNEIINERYPFEYQTKARPHYE
jgi:hypothetical protein